VVFGDPAGPAQLAGGAAILGGIALSSVRLPRRHGRPAVAAQAPAAAQATPEPVLVAQAAGADRPGVLDGRDLLDPLTVLDYPALLDHGGALDDRPVLDYGAVLDHHGGRRRVLAANRESSMAELAARHPADLRRAAREHGVGRPPQIGRRRPRGQIRPGGRRQETRGPGDGRRGEPRPAVRA
jgi:hypothetical protein